MIRSYFISNLRALWRNRSQTAVNLVGLTLGISCSIIVFLVVRFELSYDTYHPDADRIYRVVTKYTNSDQPGYGAGTTYPLPDAIRKDFPDPEWVTITDANVADPVIAITGDDGSIQRFKETRVMFADPEYFKIFHYNWVEGNEDALKREKTVVLTATIARKYFGDEPAINKVINFNNEYDATVSGVVSDPPLNTDFPFRMIFSMRLGANKRGWEDWGAASSSINCYLKLTPGATKESFEAKLAGWHMKYFTGGLEEDGKGRVYFLQPLNEIHFDTRFSNFGGRVVSYASLLTLGLIGLLLLLTACINFINLNTVLIISRSKEAGIRKVMGSTKKQLIFQFLGETWMVAVVALFLSLGVVELAIIKLVPVLTYRLSFMPMQDTTTLIFLIGLPFVVTMLAGLYPGISLSRFQPIHALKSRLSGNAGKGLNVRRTLIIIQLMISQALVVATIIVFQQINYFMHQPLGINSAAVVEFSLPENGADLIHRLTERMKNIQGVENVSVSNTGATSTNRWTGATDATVSGEIVKISAQIKFADENFIDTYQLKLLQGENLLRTDTATRFVVNESYVKKLGLKNREDAIGTPVDVWGKHALITGIVQDFNSTPLHDEREPLILSNGVESVYRGGVRLNTSDVPSTLKEVQKVWESVYPKYVFEYSFLDDTIAQFYAAERRSSYLIGLFASIAIFIGCIGLYGLVSFMARSKTKEIGIRKTLGASVAQVVGLFSMEFVWLTILAFVLSAPIAYYFMNQWLSNFAYRIQPGAFTFLLGVALSFLVVIATVGIKSYRAAVANPVDALRDE